MSDDIKALTSKLGAVWVFPDGPNAAPNYIGCTDADDVTEPQGDMELIRCFGADGKFTVMGEKVSPPDPITTSLTSLTFKTRTYLERIRGEYGLSLLQRDGGRADAFSNWVRAIILPKARNTEKTYAGLVNREEDNETTRGFSISAWPPLIEVVVVEGQRITITETMAINDVAMLPEADGILPYKYGVAVADADTGVKANVLYTQDGGRTWSTCAADPLAIDKHAMACGILDMGNHVIRLIVAEYYPTGGQGHTAYSDDWGATWTTVNLGGATAGHGPAKGGSLFVLDQHNIWLVGNAGYIYKSTDGGETWTAVDAGVSTTGIYQAVHFASDGVNGFAVAASGVVVRTIDGGQTWSPVTAITATPTVSSVYAFDDDHVWVGTATGKMYYSTNGGSTWTERTGFGTYSNVKSLFFVNDYVGFALVNTAGPVGKVLRTIDGGYTWKLLTTDTNTGCNILWAGDSNNAVVVGEAYSGLGFIELVAE
jgi:photosystem II stability/assembly factor-like uncharacterized protein